ncbi:MAG TPA: hypothetical protein VJN72_06050 [Gaiellales bacterium]|nr:hypothetical protein [Gaiellales bacterium]
MADGVIERPPYRSKFVLAYFILAAIVGVAVAAFIVFAASSSTNTPGAAGGNGARPAAWNGFRPKGFVADQVNLIALHVSSTYHLPNGKQLVAVKASIPPSFQNSLIITDYAVSYSSRGQTGYQVIPAADSVTYELCGLGADCAIASGKPSLARSLLLRREALELALYTFHFEPSIQTVVTYMPPAAGQKASFVYLFLRNQPAISDALARPISATLPGAKPPLASQISPSEATTVDELTAPDLYRFSFTRGQDGGVWLVFNPSGIS